ncbi:recombinase family protein [Brevibacillus borstelensis]|uniref:recombinase family protein n=1 Tax=Brevibacillus borstelensis TaxID=45462 RepID=UPI002E2514EE|nr:recombinase family protein [Brevibacillus borstelensis]MED1745743.1 recombinase family protein [Brevibacillus borstelensis]
MAVGIYVRVSTAGQLDNTSLEEQIRLCKNKAKEMGFYDSNIRIYSEGGRSGEDIDTRIELTKLREDVANGLISHVICTHPDRFSRDMTDKLIACREFEKNGAKIVFTDTEYPETPEGILFFNIMSAIAGYELALIRKRTVRGRLAKVREHKKIMPMRVPPFGYDKDENGQLVINEKERQYVQMIYEWYVLEKLTLRQIGERLYGKVMPKRGESPNWNATSISRILTSEIYIGKYYYNRRATQKVRGQLTKGGNPKKSYTVRDEKDWLVVEVDPIIDIELWKLAQKQRVLNDKNKHVGNTKYQYLLKSLLKCGHCGRRFDATTYSGSKNRDTGEVNKIRHYRCPNTVPRKYGPEIKKCVAVSLNAEQIEDYIWKQVLQIITDPDKFVARIRGQGDEALEAVRNQKSLFEKELIKMTNALDKVERKYFETESASEEKRLDKLRKEYMQKIALLEEEIRNCQSKIDAHRLEELTSEQIIYLVQKLKEQIADGVKVPFEIKRNIVEMLFEEIIVTVNHDGDDDPTNGTKLDITSVGLFDKLSQDVNNYGVCSQPQKI